MLESGGGLIEEEGEFGEVSALGVGADHVVGFGGPGVVPAADVEGAYVGPAGRGLPEANRDVGAAGPGAGIANGGAVVGEGLGMVAFYVQSKHIFTSGGHARAVAGI